MWRPQGATGRSRAARGPKSGQCLPVTRRRCFSTCASEEGLHGGEQSLLLRGRASEAPGRTMLPRIHNLPEVAWRKPRSPGPPPTRKRKQT